MTRVAGKVVRNHMYKRPKWDNDLELDNILGDWRRHAMIVHRVTITGALEPHNIDNCSDCASLIQDWEAIIGYKTGI